MPVQQLTDQTGGLGSVLGMVGGYLAANPERKAKKAQQDIENKRADAELARRGDEIRSTIAKNTAETHHVETDDTNAALSKSAYARYSPMLDTGTVGPDGKPLTGPALQKALTAIKNKAVQDGLAGEDLPRFLADAQGVIQARAPKLSDVEHGLPQPVTSGKGAWSPQQTSQHYIQAAARVMGSNMPDDQKKTLATQYLQMATASTKDAPQPMTPYQAARLRIEQQNADRPRGGGGGRGSDGLTPYERITLGHWNQTHNADGTVKSGANRDLSGLSKKGQEDYTYDDKAWNRAYLTDPDGAGAEPSPDDPKYAKRAGSGAGAGAGNAHAPTGPTKTGRSASAPGKPTLFEYSDGTWKP